MRKLSFLANTLVHNVLGGVSANFIYAAGGQAPGEAPSEADPRKVVDKFVSEYSEQIDAAGNNPKKIAEVLERALADLARIRGAQIDSTVNAQKRAIGVLVDRVCKVGDPVQERKLRASLQPQVDAINRQIEAAGTQAVADIESARKLETEAPIPGAIGVLIEENNALQGQLPDAMARVERAKGAWQWKVDNISEEAIDASARDRLNPERLVGEARNSGKTLSQVIADISLDRELQDFTLKNDNELVELWEASDALQRLTGEIQSNQNGIDRLASQAGQATAARQVAEVAPFAPKNTVAKAKDFAKRVADARVGVLKGKDRKEKKEVRYAAKSISELMEINRALKGRLEDATSQVETAKATWQLKVNNITEEAIDSNTRNRLNPDRLVSEARNSGRTLSQVVADISRDRELLEFVRSNSNELVRLWEASDAMQRLTAQIQDNQFEIDRLAERAGRSTARRQATEDALAPKTKPKPAPVVPPAATTPSPLYAKTNPDGIGTHDLGTYVVPDAPAKGVASREHGPAAKVETSGDVVERAVKKGEYMTKITKEYYGSVSDALWRYLQESSLGDIKMLKGSKASLVEPGDVIKLPKTVKIGNKTYTRIKD